MTALIEGGAKNIKKNQQKRKNIFHLKKKLFNFQLELTFPLNIRIKSYGRSKIDDKISNS